MPFVETVNLGRAFNGRAAVEGLDLTVSRGEAFGLLGPNGAGKTTTVRMLCGLLRPTSGTGYIAGREIGSNGAARAIRAMVGLLPEAPGLYQGLTAWENLDFHGRLHGLPERRRRERIGDLLKWLGLWQRRGDPVALFSRGMQQKLSLARALVHEPPLLCLDEPTTGLDPLTAKIVRDHLVDLKAQGHTVILATHNLAEAERVCDRIGILNGHLLGEGSPRELATRLWAPTTVVRLHAVTPAVLKAVEDLPFVRGVGTLRDEVHVELDDPQTRNPALVRAILGAGGEVVSLTERRPDLEDVYLRLVEDGA